MENPITETLGEYLKRERETRAVSLAELSKGTRISPGYLEAIERNDFGSISRQEFIRGFLKGYSRFLGLNSEEILRRYYFQCEWAGRKESLQQLSLFGHPPAPAEKTQEVARPEPVRPHPGKKRGKRWILVQLAIILAAVAIGLYLQHIVKQNTPQKQAPAVSSENQEQHDQRQNQKKYKPGLKE